MSLDTATLAPRMFPTFAVLIVVLTSVPSTVVCEQYDNFNFCKTHGRDYGPADWGEVGCGPRNTQTDRCPGWPFDWEAYKKFFDYKGAKNECIDCSSSTTGKCRNHRQSAIPLVRDVNQKGHYDQGEFWVGCRDKHRMFPARGTCKWEHITNNPDMPPDRRNGFRIERYGLVIRQPIKPSGRLMCPDRTDGRKHRKYASVDWSGNFPLRWQLVHEEIVTPSLHTQNGIRYDAEVIMSHMWPTNSERRQKGKISFFLRGEEGVADWSYLNQYIAEWQKVERQVKQACRGQQHPSESDGTNVCGSPPRRKKACNQCGRRGRKNRFCKSLYDQGYSRNDILHSCCDRRRLHEPDYGNSEDTVADKTEEVEMDFDEDYTGYLEDIEFSDELLQDEIEVAANGTQHRQLARGSKYDPYAWWKRVNTHYYWRYDARDNLPPCQDDVDWRVYHQPIIVSKRQIREIERLIAERVDPQTCKRDTAGCDRPGSNGKAVDVVRPLQVQTNRHTVVFCECTDWRSKVKADRDWCAKTTREQRFSSDEKYMYNFRYN